MKMKSIINRIHLLVQRICINVGKKMNNYSPLTPEERKVMATTSKLLDDETSEILMCPTSDKYYIKYDKGNVFIVFNTFLREISISVISKKMSQTIKLSSRVSNSLYRKFVNEIEKRRSKMEDEYRINVKNSLDCILDSVTTLNKIEENNEEQ